MEALSVADKRKLLKKLLRSRIEATATEHNLSYGQRAIWYVQHLMPESPAYNLPSGWCILSDVDIPALRQTFQWLTDRHPSLRTTYSLRDNRPVQITHPNTKVHFRVIDVSESDKGEFIRQVDREAYRPFNLETGPVMRVTVYLREPGNHLMLVNCHHIAVDLWSMNIILNEISILYSVARDGLPMPASPVNTTYSDFITWQEDLLRGSSADELLSYWYDQLAGDIQPFELPTDFPRTARNIFPGAVFPFTWDTHLTENLQRFANDCRTTLYTVLLSGFQTLLYTYSGQSRFLVRSLSVGRNRAEFEPIIGFFANPILIRADHTGDPNFHDIVARTHETISGAVEHQDYPFELLMEKLHFGRDTGYNPMSQVMFILQTPQRFRSVQRGKGDVAKFGVFMPGNTGIRLDLNGLVLEKCNPAQQVVLNDLDIEMVKVSDALSGGIRYRTDLFRLKTITRLTARFEHIMKQVVNEPHRPLSELLDMDTTSIEYRLPPDHETSNEGEVAKTDAESEPESVFPRTEKEAIITRIWQETLGTETVRSNDNFFESGGHSLLALQLISRIRSELAVELPLDRFFENPTIMGLAETIENPADGLTDSTIKPVPRNDSLPLSFAQERLWFIDRMMGGSAFYNIPVSVKLKGPINISLLKKSLAAVVHRHESLRTVFRLHENGPVQKILPSRSPDIPMVDLTGYSNAEVEKIAENMAIAEAGQPFDLHQGPLIRFRLFQLRPENHLLVVTVHHIVCDGTSLSILAREFSAYYDALSKGIKFPLPALPIQYVDYASWQRNWMQGEAYQKQLSYWVDRLSDVSSLELTPDHPRPRVPTYRGRRQSFEIPLSLSQQLKLQGQNQGATLFMSLLALVQLLLHRYSGQNDIVVGSPVSGRNHSDLENMIGCFINVLTLRICITGDQSFEQLLDQIRMDVLEAFSHQDLPFEKIVASLPLQRDISREPLFQVMLAFQNIPFSRIQLTDGVVMEPAALDPGTTRYDLTFFFAEHEDGIKGVLEYNEDIFTDTTASHMIEYFLMLLKATLTNPSTPVSTLSIGLERTSNSVYPHPVKSPEPTIQDTCVHQLIREQALKNPDAIAVQFETESISYGILDRKADGLARHLRDLGVHREKSVGIFMKPHPDMVVGILSILKAGAAYVPLDPILPEERIDFMLKDAGIQLIMTQTDLLSRLPDASAPKICLDDLGWPDMSAGGSYRSDIPPDEPAYIIYTSGSTGTPKGTVISHRSLLNYLNWCTKTYEMDGGTATLLHSSVAFDISVTSLLGTLVAGQRIILIKNDSTDIRMKGILKHLGHISHLKLTPTESMMLSKALNGTESRRWPSVLILGGEALHYEQIDFWRDLNPDIRIYNEYGPTETTVGCCVYEIPMGNPNRVGPVPIGKAISNIQLYILDAHLKPLPTGVPGELFIGGAGVAHGYLNRVELTSERFVPNPFNGHGGGRIYRTGDRVRQRPDGNLEYLGRLDDQIQLRGYRIEPEEIETAVARHPLVHQAIVTESSHKDETSSLVAYFTGVSDTTPSTSELKRFLQNKLPHYMVPTMFHRIPELPLTPTGKKARRSLPSLRMVRSDFAGDTVEPQTADQKRLARIWTDLLDLDRVGLSDDFFDLGGHSLMLMDLAHRVYSEFNVELPIISVFEFSTIETMAQLIRELKTSDEKPEKRNYRTYRLVRMRSVEAVSSPPIFFIHPAGGSVSVYRNLIRSMTIDRPVYGIQSEGLHDISREKNSLESMAVDDAGLICRTFPKGPYYLVGWSFGGLLALAITQELEKKSRAVAFLGILDAHVPAEAGNIHIQGLAEQMGAFDQEKTRSTAGVNPDFTAALDPDRFYRFYGSIRRLPMEERVEKTVTWLASYSKIGREIPIAVLHQRIALIEKHNRLAALFALPEVKTAVHLWEASEPPGESFGSKPLHGMISSSGGVISGTAPGNHFTMLHPGHASGLAQSIEARLRQTDETTNAGYDLSRGGEQRS